MIEVNLYYSEKLNKYGPTPHGVDWNSEIAQTFRFLQFAKQLPNPGEKFSLCDFGCGYGAFYDYIHTSYLNLDYTGYDINENMIAAAHKKFHDPGSKLKFISIIDSDQIFDYTISSGVFNIKMNIANEEWIEHIKSTLSFINSITTNTFAFNILSSYSDEDKRKSNLFYADPSFWFDYCKNNFSKNVALLHDYGFYEFLMVVRK